MVGLINPYLHRDAYREIGSRISYWQAFRIFHLSRIGNYLPGRIWFASNYYIFSKKLEISTEKIVKNFIVLNLCLFLTGFLLSLPILTLLSPFLQKLALIVPFFLLFLLHPKVFNKILSVLLRDTQGEYFRFPYLLKIILLYSMAYVCFGVSLYLCLSAFTVVDLSQLPILIAAGAASIPIGLLAIFAPAGIGVIEGVIGAVLAHIVPVEMALAVVLALRMIMIAIDFGCASIAATSLVLEEKRLASMGTKN